jgi:ATP-dependent DNA ligase
MTERPKREGIMLCNPATEKAVRRLGDTMFAQPKLNGERCRIEWFHDWPILLSSYGNEFKFLNHIIEAIHEHFKYDQKPLDGELYKHGWSRERIHSAASRKVNENPDTPDLEFHIFDYQSPGSQWQRINTLVVKKGIGSFEEPLIYVPYTIVTPDNWMEQAYKYTEEGYEGIILRGAIWEYEMKRSTHMLKFKPTEEDEYTILGVYEAISQEGNPKGMVGSFSVYGDDNIEFYVGAGKLTHSERVRYWENRGEIKGSILKVKHEKIKTVNGIPICAVAVEVIE